MPGPVAMPACGKLSATYCRIAAFSVSTSPSSVRKVGTSPSGFTLRKSEPSFCTTLVLGSTSRKLAEAPASYSAILVPIEQASGEKYTSMSASLGVDQPRRRKQTGRVDFYTVPHNIHRVKEFFAKWYKKVKSRR